MNVNEQDKEHSSSERLMEREQVKDSPFWIVGNKDEGYALVMGRYKLSENKETIAKVKAYLKTNMWEIIVGTIISIALDVKEDKEGNIEKIIGNQRRRNIEENNS